MIKAPKQTNEIYDWISFDLHEVSRLRHNLALTALRIMRCSAESKLFNGSINRRPRSRGNLLIVSRVTSVSVRHDICKCIVLGFVQNRRKRERERWQKSRCKLHSFRRSPFCLSLRNLAISCKPLLLFKYRVSSESTVNQVAQTQLVTHRLRLHDHGRIIYRLSIQISFT